MAHTWTELRLDMEAAGWEFLPSHNLDWMRLENYPLVNGNGRELAYVTRTGMVLCGACAAMPHEEANERIGVFVVTEGYDRLDYPYHPTYPRCYRCDCCQDRLLDY